jgi:hypothetical protein
MFALPLRHAVIHHGFEIGGVCILALRASRSGGARNWFGVVERGLALAVVAAGAPAF